MSASLQKIQTQISATLAEINATERALPPLADQLEQVHSTIQDIDAAKSKFIDRAAVQVAMGDERITVHGLFGMHNNQSAIAALALSLAAAAYGHERLSADIRERVTEFEDSKTLRLTSEERTERLTGLRRRLYELELSEEAALDGAARRANCNPAAVLGIPVEVAEQFDLLGMTQE